MFLYPILNLRTNPPPPPPPQSYMVLQYGGLQPTETVLVTGYTRRLGLDRSALERCLPT